MASSTSTRRVLSDLNVNATLVSTPLKTSGKLFGEVMADKGENAAVVTIGYTEGKRGIHEVQEGESASKRRKISVSNGRGFKSPSPQSSPSISPASSFGHSFGASVSNELNDSQTTTFSIPDEYAYSSSQPQPQSSPLTPDQLRTKARAIRLRLSLASYKVRTNQIDVPIARLEIRSSQSLPQLRRAASYSNPRSSSQQRRTALPDKPVEIRSSPPISNTSAPVSPQKGMGLGIEGREGGFPTAILQRQRMGLLNPPFLGGDESSVVKGRAADGLMSLMRMAN